MSKRPRSDGPLATGPQRKRSKMHDARKIPIQSSAASSPAHAGQPGLPVSIDLEKFLHSRAFEMTAMQDAMKKSREAGSIRAWQTLPRHLRRRAASHYARRLPTRLRAKARVEMDPEKPGKPPKSARAAMRRKLYKNVGRSAVLLKRQANKCWLETHLWHAKRAKMINIWGFRLAEKPTEKCFRAAYRASQHGCVLHDSSYFGTLRVRGLPNAIGECLKACCDPFGPSPASAKYISGARQLDTNLYGAAGEPRTEWPRGLVGPISIIWRAREASSDPSLRDVLVRTHPSVTRQAERILERCAAAIRTRLYKTDPTKGNALQVLNLSDELLSFELTGPRATEVLGGVLNLAEPLGKVTNAGRREALQAIKAGVPPAAFPTGMIVGTVVHDPRLSFPPQKPDSRGAQPDSVELKPSAAVAEPGVIGDTIVKLGESYSRSAPKFRKRDLDQRRSQLPMPGTRLKASPDDQRVSVLCVQRTLRAPDGVALVHNSTQASYAGWTLLLPKGWGMTFWHSLVFSSVRVGGLRERRQQAFEAGVPSFPWDWPTTAAFQAVADEAAHSEESYWNRRPPAKRPGFKALGTPSPFIADWTSLVARSRIESTDHLVSTQPQVPPEKPLPLPYLLAGPFVAGLMEAMIKIASTVSGDISLLERMLPDIFTSVGRQLGPDAAHSYDHVLLQSAIVRCAVEPTDRGSPQDLGLIYRLPVGSTHAPVDVSEMDAKGIIGYITSGNYSLKQGSGSGIGCVPLSILFVLILQHKRKPLVAFRNKQSRIVHTARLHILV